MQFINNFFNDRRKITIAVLGFAAVIVILLIFLMNSKGNEPYEPNEYYDDFSKQTVSSPTDKDSELYAGQPYGGVIFLGFDTLLSNGLTETQLETVRLALSKSTLLDSTEFKEFSLNISDFKKETVAKSGPGTSFKDRIKTQIKLGREKIADIDITFYEVTEVELSISENGKVLYESGQINEEILSAD